jgi:hypothetical protein
VGGPVVTRDERVTLLSRQSQSVDNLRVDLVEIAYAALNPVIPGPGARIAPDYASALKALAQYQALLVPDAPQATPIGQLTGEKLKHALLGAKARIDEELEKL